MCTLDPSGTLLAPIPEGIAPFLRGNAFATARRVRWRAPSWWGDRLTLLERLVAGQRVVHLGFADHIGVIAEKRARGSWVHDRLRVSAERCVGIDLDADAVEHCRSLGIPDIYCRNILIDGMPGELQGTEWDVVVMGELIEHLPDPVGFLGQLRSQLPGVLLLVTAPNAWSAPVMLSALRGSEVVNTDHQAWYTPFTLAKQLVRSGYSPIGWTSCVGFPLARRRLFARSVARCFPLFRNGVVMAAVPQ
ncbi:MAG: methyltransferase domain-containing protein [Planctomycetota bacterium]|jgi:hypothetical protein|nr:methyltransferase domain-containing protein [Planctomycetota bacterium]